MGRVAADAGVAEREEEDGAGRDDEDDGDAAGDACVKETFRGAAGGGGGSGGGVRGEGDDVVGDTSRGSVSSVNGQGPLAPFQRKETERRFAENDRR